MTDKLPTNVNNRLFVTGAWHLPSPWISYCGDAIEMRGVSPINDYLVSYTFRDLYKFYFNVKAIKHV